MIGGTAPVTAQMISTASTTLTNQNAICVRARLYVGSLPPGSRPPSRTSGVMTASAIIRISRSTPPATSENAFVP